MDLFQGARYDYVDNPYWSVFQLKVKPLLSQNTEQADLA